MKNLLIGCGIFVFGFLAVCGIIAFTCVVTVNKENTLRQTAPAQEKANEATFDTVWKVIAQKAEIKDDYREDFRKSWTEIVAAQNSGGREGGLKVFVNRFNPKLDSSIYKELMTTVEVGRKEFLTSQKKLIDIKREHDILITSVPQKWILGVFGNVTPLDIKIVTSGRTSDTFESGREDDISLRPGQKKPEEKKVIPTTKD